MPLCDTNEGLNHTEKLKFINGVLVEISIKKISDIGAPTGELSLLTEMAFTSKMR